MAVTPPIAPDQAVPSLQKIYGRIAETIGQGEVPVGYQMMGHCEPYCQDSYMNYRKFIADDGGKLNVKQREIIALATSSAMNCVHCVRHHAKDVVASGVLTQAEMAEVLAITATCSMYNTYYKFKDLSGDDRFQGYSVGLRAHTFQKNSLGQELTELINVVVSNINGCEMCTTGHTKKAIDLGLTHEQIDEAIKVSATIVSFNVFHRTQ